MNSETYKLKDGKNLSKKSNPISSNKKEHQIEKALRQETEKRKRDSEITITMKTQDKESAPAKWKKESSIILVPSILSEEKRNLLEDKKRLKQMEAQSILEKIKKEVLTRHLDNLGTDSRKRSPTLRDLAIQRTQPIQNILEQEVSAKVIPISAGDAYLRNMSRSPDLHKSFNSKITSNNNSQISSAVPIRHTPKEDREQSSYNGKLHNTSNFTPYHYNTRTYNHYQHQKQDSLKINTTQGKMYNTNSEKIINAYSTDSNKIKDTEGIQEIKKGQKVKLESDSYTKGRDEEIVKADTHKHGQKSIIDNLNDSKEFDLISEVNPEKYSKDTVVISTGGKNTSNNTFLVGDPNDTKFVRKKVFYEIYGKNFSNRLSDFLLRKQKSSQSLIQTKIEQEQKDINEKMKMNQKRTKFNQDVSAKIVHHRNIFNGQRSPENLKSNINEDETLLSHKAPSNYDKNSNTSNNTSIISRDYSDVSFKKIDRGGVVFLKCRKDSLNEQDFIATKKLSRHDTFRIPQKQMHNAAKFIQVVWKEHSKIRKYYAVKIQSKWRGFKLRSKVESVLYDYYLLQNKIVNLEKLIAQQFSRRLLNYLVKIYNIDKINRHNILMSIVLIQKMFKRYCHRKNISKTRKILLAQENNIGDGQSSNVMTGHLCSKKLMKCTPEFLIKEKEIIKPLINDQKLFKVNVKNVIKKISNIQKNFRKLIAIKKLNHEASYRKKISPKIITKKCPASFDVILKVIKIQAKWKQIINKKKAIDKLKSIIVEKFNRNASSSKDFIIVSYLNENQNADNIDEMESLIKNDAKFLFSSKFTQIFTFKTTKDSNIGYTKIYKNIIVKKIIQLQKKVKTLLKNNSQKVLEQLQNKLIAKGFTNSIFDKVENINKNSDFNLDIEVNRISEKIKSGHSKKNSEKLLSCRYSIEHSDNNILFSIPHKHKKATTFKPVTKENKNYLFTKILMIQRLWKEIRKKNDKKTSSIIYYSKRTVDAVSFFSKNSQFLTEKNIVTIQKHFRRTIANKNKQNLIIKNYKQSQIKSQLICEEISLCMTTEVKDKFLRLISVMNKVTLKENLKEMRAYQLNDMSKQLFSRLIHKARLKLILLPLKETNTRIRLIELIYEITKSFKRAAGIFIFSKLSLNLTAHKHAMRNKQIIELMHKQMTGNYNNAIELYVKQSRRNSNLETQSKVRESTSLNYEEGINYNGEMHRSNKDFSQTYIRNVYSYGWYLNAQPKAVPYVSSEEKLE